MKQKNFHVSIKTVDDKPLFPPTCDGQRLLFPLVSQAAMRVGVLTTGFATFPTGVEVIANCNDTAEAKGFADALSALLYEHNNAIGHIIESFGIHIGELTTDERTLHAFMTDMMMRSMAARMDLSENSDSAGGSDKELFHLDIDLNDLDNVKVTPLGKKGKGGGIKGGGFGRGGFRPGGFKAPGKKRFS
jgi:hypothetical protein